MKVCIKFAVLGDGPIESIHKCGRVEIIDETVYEERHK